MSAVDLQGQILPVLAMFFGVLYCGYCQYVGRGVDTSVSVKYANIRQPYWGDMLAVDMWGRYHTLRRKLPDMLAIDMWGRNVDQNIG